MLLRHGIAEDRDARRLDDADRRLTKGGRERMRAAAKGMVRLGVSPDAVLTSPLTRCRETAEIVCEALGHGAPVQITGLAPGADLERIAELSAERPDSQELLVCGHQPDLSDIARELTGGDVLVKKGSLIAIDVHRVRPHGGTLLAVYPPRALRALGT